MLSNRFLEFGRRDVLGIPIVVYYLVALAFLLWYVLECTPLGRHLFATGSNPEAARLSGVRTDRMVWGSLVASAVVAGIAGIVYGAKIGSFSNCDPVDVSSASLAASLGKETQAAAPIVVRGEVWGSLWVASLPGDRPLATADVPRIVRAANEIARVLLRPARRRLGVGPRAGAQQPAHSERRQQDHRDHPQRLHCDDERRVRARAVGDREHRVEAARRGGEIGVEQ